MLSAGAAGEGLLLGALGGDGKDTEDVDGGAVNPDGDWDKVDDLFDELVAAGCLLVVGALVLSGLAGGSVALNVLCWECSCREGKGKGRDDVGELHLGLRVKVEDWTARLFGWLGLLLIVGLLDD